MFDFFISFWGNYIPLPSSHVSFRFVLSCNEIPTSLDLCHFVFSQFDILLSSNILLLSFRRKRNVTRTWKLIVRTKCLMSYVFVSDIWHNFIVPYHIIWSISQSLLTILMYISYYRSYVHEEQMEVHTMSLYICQQALYYIQLILHTCDRVLLKYNNGLTV